MGKSLPNAFVFPLSFSFFHFGCSGLFCVRLGTTWAATNPPSQQRSFDSGSEALCCVLSHQRRRLGAFHTPFAVAKRSREQDPDVEVVLYPQWLPCICLNRKLASLSLPPARLLHVQRHDVSFEWNAMEELLATVFEIHRPSVFVFDGAFPYRSMLNAIKNRTGLTNVWLLPRAFKKGGQKFQLTALNTFTTSFVRGTVLKRRWRRLISVHLSHISNQFFLPNQKTFSQGKKLGFDWAFQWIQQPFTFNWVLEKSTTLRDNLRWRFGCSTSMKRARGGGRIHHWGPSQTQRRWRADHSRLSKFALVQRV